MSARTLAARCIELLGPVAGRVIVQSPRATRIGAALARRLTVAGDDAPATAAIVVWLRVPASPAERQAALRALDRCLPGGSPLLVVDHNQPRSVWRRVVGAAALALAGLAPVRGRYPAARELAALGYAVERLRLACGERVQIVVARRRAPDG